MRVAFRGHGAGNFNIHIDNIEVNGEEDYSSLTEAGDAGIKVVAGKGEIRISGLSGVAKVFDLAGREVASLGNDGTVKVPAGVYAVVCGKETFKVLVK